MGCCKIKGEKKHPSEETINHQTGVNTVHPENQMLLNNIADPSYKDITKGNVTPEIDTRDYQKSNGKYSHDIDTKRATTVKIAC